jgi:transposase
MGKAKAVTAVSHSVLVIIYHVLRDQKPYQDLGADYFDRLDTHRLANQSVKRLEALGFQVTLQPREEVPV